MKGLFLLPFLLFCLFQPLAAQEFASSGGAVKLQVSQMPQATGPGVVAVQLLDAQGRPALDWQITEAELQMPGMEMDLPPVKIAPQGGNRWNLLLDTPMQGLWKVNLALRRGEAVETATLKFVIP